LVLLTRYASLRADAKQSQEQKRKRTDKSFLVPFDEIKANNWDLSINRYKEIIYEEIAYAAPSEIINEIETLDQERNQALTALKEMLR
jgi:type I restriction enzyme M protein